jgi:hypothetical protein
MTATKTVKKVEVKAMPEVKVTASKKANIFNLVSVEVSGVDKKKKAVKEALATFTSTYKMVKAPDEKQAVKLFETFLTDIFEVKAPKTASKKTDSKKAPEKAPEASKPEAPEEKKQKAPEAIATFKHFCETRKARLIKLSPDNEKIVKTSLEQFERYNKTIFSTLSDNEMKLLTRKDNIKATDSLINRDSIRLLISEVDEKKKPVCQLLLKPVYMSPYSFACIVEAHNRDKKKPSMYEWIANTVESELTCYDAFQFNPLRETLTTAEVEETKNKVSYQFVNLIVE